MKLVFTTLHEPAPSSTAGQSFSGVEATLPVAGRFRETWSYGSLGAISCVFHCGEAARRAHSDGGARVMMSSASGAIRALRALV